MRVALEENPKPEEVAHIRNSLYSFNEQYGGPRNYTPLYVFLRDDNNKVLGGILGATYWDWAVMDIFWISEEMRCKGYGSKILKLVEEEAVKRGCTDVQLNTHDFQAVEFYKKYGYTVYGELKNFPEGFIKYSMQKRIKV